MLLCQVNINDPACALLFPEGDLAKHNKGELVRS